MVPERVSDIEETKGEDQSHDEEEEIGDSEDEEWEGGTDSNGGDRTNCTENMVMIMDPVGGTLDELHFS